ncbi:RNA polymerase sigma factor [Xanthomonas sp. LMG 12461]|uniref:RNA polymerase sigma factor n=1 Tax=Xanthomonas sp. LMG 12461 TaxID=2014543 RepID=UPI0012651CBD|nr:RNA polymerase sigma factor [Xanthomonas sp. LMG 12461]KAB7763883.1 RNA polymerase subunit sigma [Xanthomonas sp. LMG 12461]
MNRAEHIEGAPSPEQAPAHQVDALFKEHHRALLAFLHCKLGSMADAQDVAQEAYMRIVTLERPDALASPRAYLFHVASNLAVDRLRMRKVRENAAVELPEHDLPLPPVPERHATASEQLRALTRALQELPAKTSRAFVLHVIEGKDFGMIAKAMNVSERMVRYHVANALAHCRKRFDEAEIP